MIKLSNYDLVRVGTGLEPYYTVVDDGSVLPCPFIPVGSIQIVLWVTRRPSHEKREETTKTRVTMDNGE